MFRDAETRLSAPILLQRAYKNGWEAANARRSDFIGVRNDGLVVNPNLWDAAPSTATLSGIEFSGQNRMFMRLDVPFEKASSILFSVRLTATDAPGSLIVGCRQVIQPGRHTDLHLEFEPFTGSANLEISTRIVEGGNTQWAWAHIRWPVIHDDSFEPVVGMPPLAQVLDGKDGWLFLDNDTNDSLAQTEGHVIADDATCERWRDDIRKREEICADIGAALHLQIVPNKETVFPWYLPDHVKLAEFRTVHKVLDKVGEASVTFPVALLQAPAPYVTYSKADTHWTDYGAFLGTNDVLHALGIEPLKIEDATFQRVISSGDLGVKLLERRVGDNAVGRPRDPRAKKIFDNMINNHGRMWIFENPASEGPTALLFGDSFNIYGAKWLAERFRRLVYIHSVSADETLIREEMPGVVIGEVVERFLIIPPENLTTFSIEGLWERKYRLMTPEVRTTVLTKMEEVEALTASPLAGRCIAALRRVIAEDPA